ncbi:MAG: agmatinase [Actinobacteria bacterium]|nr:agmatinase [Actinomycetota bacterium]
MGSLMYGPDFTFLGVSKCDAMDSKTYSNAEVVIIGAPFDGGTSYRSGAKFGPSAVRKACYLEHDGKRPSLALRVDGLTSLQVHDAGDVQMPSGNTEIACARLEQVVAKVAGHAIPLIIGGDHTVTWPNVTGIAKAKGWGNIAVLHFDAHADTGEITEGALIGHGQPMRKLIESGAVRGDRFFQIGLRGYWPDEPTLNWMAQQGMRSYEMSEIGARGLNVCLTEIFQAVASDCDGVFLSVDIDVADPAAAPGTGTPEPGGLSARELLDAVRRICLETHVVGMDVVEVAPAYDHADITSLLANRVILEALSALAKTRTNSVFDPNQPLLDER